MRWTCLAVFLTVGVTATGCDPYEPGPRCDWGGVCGEGEQCHAPTQSCQPTAVIEACEGLDELAPCSYAGGPAEARCLDGLCLAPRCGDGVVDPGLGEACDDASGNSGAPDATCRVNCTLPGCGDGVVDPGLGEACDDGNTADCDGCRSDCVVETGCGDGVRCDPEPCDGADVNGHTCGELGWSAGVVECTTDCTLDTSDCRNDPVSIGVLADVTDLALSTTRVYAAHATILSLPKTGGTADSFVTGSAPIATDPTHLYYMLGADLMKVPLTGGPPTTLAFGITQPGEIVVDDTRVYWITSKSVQEPGDVLTVPLAGGAPATLATGQPLLSGLAVSDTHLYWTCGTADGTVMAVALAGGTPTPLAIGLPQPLAVAVDATHVYWTQNGFLGAGSLMKVPVGGGTPVALVDEASRSGYLAVDATHAYFIAVGTDTSVGDIKRVPLAGGATFTLAASESAPAHLVLDDTHAYWKGAFAIRRVPK